MQIPNVRKATSADLETLKQFKLGLIQAELPMDETIKEDTTSYYDLKALITNDNSELLVADIDGELVASGYAQIIPDRPYLKHDFQGYLGFMYVPEEHRGNGYNKLVLNALLKWCKSRRVFEIKLDVYDTNLPALRAYEKAGFKKHLINMRLDIRDIEL
ncbi:GNAT family N-acetyltransferase [uncultured Psychroserpens sp.]|uniref:GNAT family N-acetyltransferase n=1 Tax=uncultured Psychroserpens sp. TaxID=255436 RepID=UPI00262B4A33|nr:GNAT family N-acetyltransferase [uncultured Psychroserpens sp.]